MGFVESLVAIILVGVASVVLMRIAGSTMMEAIRNERIDKMTQFAIEGATMTETIILEMVEEYPLNEKLDKAKEKLNLDASSTKCFIPQRKSDSDMAAFDFVYEGEKYRTVSVNSSFKPNDRKNSYIAIKEKDVVNNTERTDYFRYVCISIPSVKQARYLDVRVIVGHILSEGEVTANRDVKDYIYSTIISL